MSKRLSLFVVILFIALTISLRAAAAQDGPAADYRQLPDLHLFADERHGMWAGSGGLTLDTEQAGGNPVLPIDEDERFNELPSLRVNATGEVGWWSVIAAGKDWEPYSIRPYYPTGALEFNIKSSNGPVNFNLAISDIEHGRSPRDIKSNQVAINDFVQTTDSWQHVVIPLRHFISSEGMLNLDQINGLEMSGANPNPIQFWINDIRITSIETEFSYPVIKINQVGFTPTAPKLALVSGFAEQLPVEVGTAFEVRSLQTSEIAFEGSLTLVTEYDAVVSGEKVLAADFTALTVAGDYYVTVAGYGIEDSPPFTISETVYDELLIDSLRYFYLQRSGMPLERAYAGLFARSVGHPQDAIAAFRSGREGTLDVSGGWYDAGDYGKYVNAGANAVSDLLWSYEMFPAQFGDGQLNIPESGNGVADILDEVRWELDWLLKMQDQASGGFYHMVQPTENSLPDLALDQRFIMDTDGVRGNVRPSSSSASVVAALAHAAFVFESVDSDYAATLLEAAEFGWQYLEANPDGVERIPGPYGDNDDSDERFWAAAALYRATGDDAYHDYLKQVFRDVVTLFDTPDDNAYGIKSMGMIGWLVYMHSDDRDDEMETFFAEQFGNWSERMVARWEASAWQLTMLDEDFYWGSNFVALATPLVLVVGNDALEKTDPTAAIISQHALDYVLGTNPLRFSYVSGYGIDSLERPFSQVWSNDGIEEPPAGILAGGPNAYTNPLFYSNFAGKRYFDSNGAWTINEHTIYWNSALVFNVALAAERAGESSEPVVADTVNTVAAPSSTSSDAQAPVDDSSNSTAAEANPAPPVVAEESDASQGSGNGSLFGNIANMGLLFAILLVNILILIVIMWRWPRRNPQ